MSKVTKKGKNPGTVDSWLDALGFYRKNVAYDETCLFRAVSEQLFDCQVYHERVRKECLEYARNNLEEFKFLERDDRKFVDHLNKLEKHMVVCGTIELQIISRKYNKDVKVFDAVSQEIIDVTKQGLPNPLLLCLMDEDHYDVIYKKEHIVTAGFCQSIIYKLLYEEVFHIPHVDDIVNSMLYEKSNAGLPIEINEPKKESNNNEVNTSTDSSDCMQSPVGSVNIAPFPFKVAKALDPTIYRNIEYDSWGEVRRELRLGDWYYGDDKLILGTRCIFNDRNRNENLECYIQEIIKDQNKCVVYLIKFAEKKTVNYADLSPENDAKPWPLPYRFSKNLVIGPTPPPVPDKVSKSIKKRNKDKRRTKSCSESSAISNTISNSETENVNAYVGIPLQMHNPNESGYRTPCEVNNNDASEPATSQHVDAAPEAQTTNNRFQWEGQHWHPYLTPTPDPYVWPQTPTTPQNVFNFAMKPMVASAPVTPDVISYYDPNYPYYYNYHNYDLCNTYNTWSTNPDYTAHQQQNAENPEKPDESKAGKVCEGNQNEPNAEAYAPAPERLTLNTSIANPLLEVYSPMIPIHPGTPVIYTAPHDMSEMMMPTTPITVFTPPVDVQYVSPGPYVYPPTPPTAWYPAPINSQGFIFPPPAMNNQTAVQK